jgi:hypothetical protein
MKTFTFLRSNTTLRKVEVKADNFEAAEQLVDNNKVDWVVASKDEDTWYSHEDTPSYVSAIVGIDAYNDKSLQYNGYLNISRGTLNGWHMPWLDKKSAKRFIKRQLAFIETIKDDKYQLEHEQEFHDEIMGVKPQEVFGTFDGKDCTKTLYDFGQIGICWDLYKENE